MLRFEQGLTDVGILETLRRNAEVMKGAFIYNPIPLNAEMISNVFAVNSWPPQGSNRYRSEKKAIVHWEDLLLDLQGTVHCSVYTLRLCLLVFDSFCA